MKKLLLFLALAAVLVSGCTGTTGTDLDENRNVDVNVNNPPADDVQTADQELVESEVLEEEDETTGSSDDGDLTEAEEPEEGPEFVRLLDASISSTEVESGEELLLSFGIYNNETEPMDYNVVIQIFDEDEERVYNQQEEGIRVLTNKTKWMELPITISGNTFKRGETYAVHTGLFNEDWELVEWNWDVGNFTVT